MAEEEGTAGRVLITGPDSVCARFSDRALQCGTQATKVAKGRVRESCGGFTIEDSPQLHICKPPVKEVSAPTVWINPRRRRMASGISMATEPFYTTYVAVLSLAFLSVFTRRLGVSLAIYLGRREQGGLEPHRLRVTE